MFCLGLESLPTLSISDKITAIFKNSKIFISGIILNKFYFMFLLMQLIVIDSYKTKFLLRFIQLF